VTAAPRATAIMILRLAEVVLRNSLFRSGYELLYTPVAPARKRPTKAIVDVACDRVGTIVGSAVVALVLALGPASPMRLLVGLASACSVVMLVLAVRFHRAYLSALVESLRLGVVRLESEDLVDATTRLAVQSVAGDEIRASLPSPDAGTDAVVGRLALLRSGQAESIRRALAEGELDLCQVTTAAGLLARDELFGEALAALRRVAPRCTGQLVDVMLDHAHDPVVRRRIPRVLAAVPDQRAADGLMIALRDERFDLRYRAAQALVRLRQRNASLLLDPAAVFSAARHELERAGPSSRMVDHVFTILSLALEREPLEISLRAVRGSDQGLRGTALEYLDNVLPGAIREGIWPWLGLDRPTATGRARDEMRDELLRSSSRWGRSGSRRRDAIAGRAS
jgi:AAA family ATP:ADP antiporter